MMESLSISFMSSIDGCFKMSCVLKGHCVTTRRNTAGCKFYLTIVLKGLLIIRQDKVNSFDCLRWFTGGLKKLALGVAEFFTDITSSGTAE
jgi:hypothetical protein